MSKLTGSIKSLFTDLDSSIFNIEEKIFIAIEDLEEQLTQKDNAIDELVEHLRQCATYLDDDLMNKYVCIANEIENKHKTNKG